MPRKKQPYSRERYLRNRAQILEYQRQRYAADPNRAHRIRAAKQARVDNWDTNPLPLLKTLIHSARHRAKVKNLEFDLTATDLLSHLLSSDYRCAATGIRLSSPATDLPTTASLDRIDSSRGYVRDNVRLVTKLYNTAKMTWSDDDVVQMAIGLLNCRGKFASSGIS